MQLRSGSRAFVLLLVSLLFASCLWALGCGANGASFSTDSGIDEEDAESTAADAGADAARPRDAGPVSDAGDATPDAKSATFNVVNVTSLSATKIVVVFDAPPTTDEAVELSHYNVPGLTLTAAQLAGSSVTMTTAPQAAQAYVLGVTGVTRASDKADLANVNGAFTGRAPFNVVSAKSEDAVTMSITFDAAPTAAQATKASNYTAPGLTFSGTPTLAGNTVKLRTSPQLAQNYTVTVANVTRGSDVETLATAAASFMGTAAQLPTVTNVVVTATNPNNNTTPYNTGTSTVTITGTDFAGVDCASAQKGVRLDDLDGIDAVTATRASACTVVSNTEITATFPAGIRTNGATGWNVIVEGIVGSNATSNVRFVPVAGLLISEVYTGTSGATDHEFVELYNPTGTSIDTRAAGIGLKLHVRSSSGGDTNKTLTGVSGGIVPSHGFLLLVSSASDAGDAWFANRDYTFSAALVGNGGVYISLSTTDNAKVLDKVGWGTQVAGGYETAAVANIASNFSAERKPAGGNGHATDTDSNAADFNAPTNVPTPRGIADGPQP